MQSFNDTLFLLLHVYSCSQTSRTTLSAGRQAVGDVPAREGSLNTGGNGLRPHPPSAPADPSILRIQKKRVQLLSGGKRTTSSKVQTTKQTAAGSDDVATEGDNVSTVAGEANSQAGVTSRGDVGDEGSSLDGGGRETAAEISTIPSEEELAVVNILKSAGAVPPGKGEGLKTHKHGIDGADQMEMSEASGRDEVKTSSMWSHDMVETSGVWSDDVASETTYFYLSHPKSASDVKV